jgi:hypothetical protein
MQFGAQNYRVAEFVARQQQGDRPHRVISPANKATRRCRRMAAKQST